MDSEKSKLKKLKDFAGKLIPSIILLDVILAAAVFAGICFILSLFGLIFRQWIFAVVAVVLGFLGIIGLFQVLGLIKQRILKLVLTWIVIIGVICGTPILLIVGYLFYIPEHVVMKDGEKYVARVYGYIDTNVSFYEYHNFLVRGSNFRIRELYDGGFDPYADDDQTYEPMEIYYYDAYGNEIN